MRKEKRKREFLERGKREKERESSGGSGEKPRERFEGVIKMMV